MYLLTGYCDGGFIANAKIIIFNQYETTDKHNYHP
ncbi:hypothetical protein GASC598I20_013700 [Gilliamella apicola SCGC AB-598-I20]|nr:hypothetical protein GASC598I20_013700 [Gilliamella apicola SCGC AB-598-I20]